MSITNVIKKGQQHKQDYNTPLDFFKKLNDEFHFKLDACTTSDNPLGTPAFYTKEQNGLKQDWINTTYYNPPYQSAYIWLCKAFVERSKGVTSVGLLKDDSSTWWFHDFVYDMTTNDFRPHVKTRYVLGRLSFNENRSYFPSILVIMSK